MASLQKSTSLHWLNLTYKIFVRKTPNTKIHTITKIYEQLLCSCKIDTEVAAVML